MAVKIRMKKLGKAHQPFFRICAIDSRSPRDGRVIEELGHYDPMIRDTDARAILKSERIDYWLSVGAQPSDKVKVLIKKYGTEGTHLEQQKEALDRLGQKQRFTPMAVPKPAETPKDEEPAAAEPAADETPAEEPAAKSDETTAAETPTEEASAEDKSAESAEQPAEESKEKESSE